VADIISIDEKLKISREKQAALIRRRKIQAVQKVFQCTQCSFKCEKCGSQINPEKASPECNHQFQRVPYHFCKSCEEEYLDYIDRLQGKGNPEWYWHNEQWLKLWKDWISYQSSVDLYLKSKEFSQLVEELKKPGPDDVPG
jgi:hypothetical protein